MLRGPLAFTRYKGKVNSGAEGFYIENNEKQVIAK
jgi:hypothetical protein